MNTSFITNLKKAYPVAECLLLSISAPKSLIEKKHVFFNLTTLAEPNLPQEKLRKILFLHPQFKELKSNLTSIFNNNINPIKKTALLVQIDKSESEDYQQLNDSYFPSYPSSNDDYFYCSFFIKRLGVFVLVKSEINFTTSTTQALPLLSKIFSDNMVKNPIDLLLIKKDRHFSPLKNEADSLSKNKNLSANIYIKNNSLPYYCLDNFTLPILENNELRNIITALTHQFMDFKYFEENNIKKYKFPSLEDAKTKINFEIISDTDIGINNKTIIFNDENFSFSFYCEDNEIIKLYIIRLLSFFYFKEKQ